MTVIALNPPTPKKWDRVRTNNKTLAIAIVIELIIVGAVLFASYQFAQRYSDGDNMQWWMAIICGIVYAMVELARGRWPSAQRRIANGTRAGWQSSC